MLLDLLLKQLLQISLAGGTGKHAEFCYHVDAKRALTIFYREIFGHAQGNVQNSACRHPNASASVSRLAMQCKACKTVAGAA